MARRTSALVDEAGSVPVLDPGQGVVTLSTSVDIDRASSTSSSAVGGGHAERAKCPTEAVVVAHPTEGDDTSAGGQKLVNQPAAHKRPALAR
jgi:hypothetical protein